MFWSWWFPELELNIKAYIMPPPQGMQYTYLSAMLTTIEKTFGIKSKETAYLMSGNEIAQILFLFFLPLTLKVKKRPLWCAIGMVSCDWRIAGY